MMISIHPPYWTMHKILLPLLLVSSSLTANLPMIDLAPDAKIGVQNTILTKVHGTSISVMDVKKKLDFLFHQNYPQLVHSNQARYQFYEAGWRNVLTEMIDQELILADAEDKEVKLTDGEIREEMERRFGPNVMSTLDQVGLTYEEALKLVKNEMLVRRMSWWFIQSRAMQSVTPQDIRQGYQNYLKEHPPYQEWTYRVISIRSDRPQEDLAKKVFHFLQESQQSPESLASALKEFETPTASIQLSTEYVATDQNLSEAHKQVLSTLDQGTYSAPSFQQSRVDHKAVHRIFYLSKKSDYPAPSFESMAPHLRDELTQKAIVRESDQYLEKLRKHYGFDPAHIKKTLPDDLHPFSLQ